MTLLWEDHVRVAKYLPHVQGPVRSVTIAPLAYSGYKSFSFIERSATSRFCGVEWAHSSSPNIGIKETTFVLRRSSVGLLEELISEHP